VSNSDYPHAVIAPAIPSKPVGSASILSWGRVRFPVIASTVLGLMFGGSFQSGAIVIRTVLVALFATLAFGLFERRPKRLPSFVARWVLQVIAVALAIPIGFVLTFSHARRGRRANHVLIGLGLLVAPWVALAALVRQKDALARHQALAFDLERSELARQAGDARLRLLQAQVAPHFPVQHAGQRPGPRRCGIAAGARRTA
jgi:hypothetical protein